jgi:hypothetical protein
LADLIPIRRSTTGTALARRVERGGARPANRGGSRALARAARTERIPWEQFERSRYTAPALALAVHAQRSLALGEYGAVHLFARLASALALAGAPLDVVRAAAAIPSDEARHAELALHMAELLSGGPVEIHLDRDKLPRDPWKPMQLEDLDASMVEVSSIGETLAAAFIGACRSAAKDPVARALFSELLADEVHHARIGWYYLAWRAPQWSRAERQRVADRAASMIMGVERQFWFGRDAPKGSRRDARALGVIDSPTQRSVVKSIMEGEIVPALDALGLGASHAWRARVRGPS